MTLSHKLFRATVHSRDVRRRYAHLYAVPPRRFPRAKHVPPGRTLHLVDIENLMGGPRAGPVALLRAISAYREAAPVTVGDHVIIGTNPRLGVIAHASWPSVRLVVRGGPDGADIALLGQVKDDRWVAARYDRIVVGSGDSVFAVVAKTFRQHGLAVGVVSREQSLSYALGRAATFVRILPDPAPTMEAA